MPRTPGAKNKVKMADKIVQKAKELGIETKGMPSSYHVETLTLAPKPINHSSVELIKLNKGFVGICNQKVASTMASIPLRLYAARSRSSEKILYAHKKLNSVQQDEIKLRTKSLSIKNSPEIIEVIEHPAFEVLNNVNDGDLNYHDLIELTGQYLGLIGNSFWSIEQKGNKTPIGIRVLPAEYTTVRVTDAMKIIGYRVSINTGLNQDFDVEDVIHYKNVSPGLFWQMRGSSYSTGLYGMGDVEQVLDEVYLYDAINNYLRALTENNAIPSGIIKYKAGRLDQHTLVDVEKQWNRALRTWKQAGKVKVMDQDFDFTPLSLPPKELDFSEGRRWLRNVISNAIGVPEDLLMTENSNKASSSTAIGNFYRFTIKPKLIRIQERLNSDFITYFDDNLFFQFDECVPADQVVELRQEQQDLQLGVLTINEVRKARGLSRVSWGDEPYTPVKETFNPTPSRPKENETSKEE